MPANGSHTFEHDLLLAYSHSKKTHTLAKGKTIFHEEEPSEGVYIICEGRLQLSVKFGSRPMPIRVAGPGFVLGLSTVFSEEPNPYTAEALEDSKLAFISAQDFQTVVKKNPDYFFQLVQSLGNELFELSTQTLHVLRLQAKPKIHL